MDYFASLGVNFNCSPKTIELAYKARANLPSMIADKQKLEQLEIAYEVLSTPALRKLYSEALATQGEDYAAELVANILAEPLPPPPILVSPAVPAPPAPVVMPEEAMLKKAVLAYVELYKNKNENVSDQQKRLVAVMERMVNAWVDPKKTPGPMRALRAEMLAEQVAEMREQLQLLARHTSRAQPLLNSLIAKKSEQRRALMKPVGPDKKQIPSEIPVPKIRK